MALISSQDRARLYRVLDAHIPFMQDRDIKNIFILMLMLLRDYETLNSHAHGHLCAITDIENDIDERKCALKIQ